MRSPLTLVRRLTHSSWNRVTPGSRLLCLARTALCSAIAILAIHSAAAQTHGPLRLGVVLPGPNAGGAHLDSLVAARAWHHSAEDRLPGIAIELVHREAGVTADDTAEAIEELLASERVHAIVCCITPEAAQAAVGVPSLVPLLLLARPGENRETRRNAYIMPASPLAVGRAMALHARRYSAGLSLLTTDDEVGDEAELALQAGLIEAGRPLLESVRYEEGTRPLTPEALLVAASVPGAAVVWTAPGDTLAALEALEARGYEGPIYLPESATIGLPGGVRHFRVRGAHLSVPPVALYPDLPEGDPNSLAVTRFVTALADVYGSYPPTPQGAIAFDALDLLLRAAEQALVYGVSPGEPNAFRQALADALIAMPPVDGAAGSYDTDGSSPDLALARGVTVATVGAGGLLQSEPSP